MATALDIGTLRHRLLVEANTPTYTAAGTVDSWAALVDTAYTDSGYVWGRIEPLSGFERIQAMQTDNVVTHRITVRYNPNLTTEHRFSYDGRLFHIQAVIDRDERNRVMVCDCEERLAEEYSA